MSGDRVAGLALNSFRHFEAWMAIPTANLIFNDLNFRLALAELEFIVNDSAATVLCADARQWDDGGRARASAARRCSSWCGWTTATLPTAHRRGTSWRPTTGASPPADLDADCVAAITYTGGTTGLPKGVMQTHGNLVVNAKHMLWANPLFESDRFLHLTPMFHSAGVANMYAQTLVAGTQITCPGFDPDLVGRMIERYRVSVCVLVPTMINMFLNHPATAERDLSSWRLCLYAASPIPMALLQRAMAELPCGFSQGYGMTEMSPHCCQLTSRGPRPGDRRRSRRRAAPRQRRHAVHRRRRRDPSTRRLDV